MHPTSRSLLLLLGALLASGCDGATEPKRDTIELRLFSDSIEVGQSARIVGVADTTLFLINLGRWTSSNPAVATVDDEGIITGKRAGTARISLEALARLGQVTVTVLDTLPDARTEAYAIVEGRALTCSAPNVTECGGLGTAPGGPWVKAPVSISCGPGLFGSRTLTDADGRYRFELRVPMEMQSDLVGWYRQLGCLLQIDPFWGEGQGCLSADGCTPTSHRVAVPIVSFETKSYGNLIRADIIQQSGGIRPRTAVENLLYATRMSDSVLVPVPTPRSPCHGVAGRPLFPNHSTVLESRTDTISVMGKASGTAAILIFTVDQCHPWGWKDTIALAGAVGVRVTR